MTLGSRFRGSDEPPAMGHIAGESDHFRGRAYGMTDDTYTFLLNAGVFLFAVLMPSKEFFKSDLAGEPTGLRIKIAAVRSLKWILFLVAYIAALTAYQSAQG